ncbi:ATP-binding protein [Stappia indica]|uniref:ATP-binding protein n=1 Tax=Stappia indica TaxID=538381 RepID=UPI001CD4D316|nr:ATP-binding protein [Stappia indica]MCA1297897.1 two-component sensor histidine kinase [Stappia indica]
MSEENMTGERSARPAGFRSVLRTRLAAQRWVLVTALVIAGGAQYAQGLRLSWEIWIAFAVLVSAALLAPGRRPLMPRRLRGQPQAAMWPDTGMKHLADALPAPCFIVDQRGIVRYANAAARERFGAAHPGDPISFRLRTPALLEALDRVIAGEDAQRIGWSEKVPTEQWLEAYVAPIAPLASEGRAPRQPAAQRFILVTVQDLSDQHRLERMRADFVANASHELRTPLASLTGFVETLMGPAKDDPQARDRFLTIMMQQGERMRRLIDDLLSLSRVELKAHVQPNEIVDLAALLRHTCDALKPVADELGVTIDLSCPDGPCQVRGDRDELIEVIENLAENSLKYGASGKRVEIDLAPAGGGDDGPAAWVLGFRDHGPGIAPEHVPRLTERFYRADISASREMKGTGLGLAIVKHILTRHKARLEIESVPGEGALFSVRIPAASSS